MQQVIFVYPLTANKCYYNEQANSYMGTEAATKSNETCQRWESQEPHRHSYKETDFPDQTMPENYCRTTRDTFRPYCYTTNETLGREICDINNCSTCVNVELHSTLKSFYSMSLFIHYVDICEHYC